MPDHPPPPARDASYWASFATTLQQAALTVARLGGPAPFDDLLAALVRGLTASFGVVAVRDAASQHWRILGAQSEGEPVVSADDALAAIAQGVLDAGAFRCADAGVAQRAIDPSLHTTAGIPLLDSAGQPLGALCVARRSRFDSDELTEAMLTLFGTRIAAEIERLRADEALRHSEASYRAIFEASEESIVIHDWTTGRVVDVNAEACASCGYTREELMGSAPARLGSGEPPYSEVEALAFLDRARRGESPCFEWQRRNKDGSLHWGEVRLKTATIGGKPHILAFRRDITDLKQVLASLRLREEQYRVIFEAASDGFVLRDGQLRTVDANPAFYRMYGFSPDLIAAGGGYPTAFPREYVEERDAQIRRALAGEPTHVETVALKADGQPFWVDLRVIPVRHRGEAHVLQIVRDISRRRETEIQRAALAEQLRQAQKMEAIGQLTGGIAHDFNNILTSVIGYIVMAIERAESRQDLRLNHQLEQAHIASQRARDLVSQMLTFARRGRRERRRLDLAPVLRQSLTLLRSTLPGTIDLQTDLPAALPPVQVDAVQVEQVLFNLCINARDAMSGRGRMQVGVHERMVEGRCASCREPLQGRWIEIAVVDEGGGIGDAVRERMFEPFYTTKPVGQGSGMGLAMVHGIVHEHGGHVVVDAVDDDGTSPRGTRFRILLPPDDSEAPAADARDTPPAALPATAVHLEGRLLLVEDEDMVARFMGERLGTWGLEVTRCANAAQAERRFAEDPQAFDLVLTDQAMPGGTGLELAARLLALRPGLPVLLYTGFQEALDADEARRLGVREVLQKPIDPQRLLAALRACLQR